jgi:hypothetical protein
VASSTTVNSAVLSPGARVTLLPRGVLGVVSDCKTQALTKEVVVGEDIVVGERREEIRGGERG